MRSPMRARLKAMLRSVCRRRLTAQYTAAAQRSSPTMSGQNASAFSTFDHLLHGAQLVGLEDHDRLDAHLDRAGCARAGHVRDDLVDVEETAPPVDCSRVVSPSMKATSWALTARFAVRQSSWTRGRSSARLTAS